MSDINLHQSITGYGLQKASEYLMVNKKEGQEDTGVKKYAKYAGGTVAFLTLSTLGTVETVLRNLGALAAKGVTFFVPKGYAETLDNKVVALFNHAFLTTASTAVAATQLVTNFLSNETRASTADSVNNAVYAPYGSDFMKATYELHINGFRQEEAAEKSEEAETVTPAVVADAKEADADNNSTAPVAPEAGEEVDEADEEAPAAAGEADAAQEKAGFFGLGFLGL